MCERTVLLLKQCESMRIFVDKLQAQLGIYCFINDLI